MKKRTARMLDVDPGANEADSIAFGDFGFAHTVDSSDSDIVDATDYNNMDVDKYVVELHEEEDFQNTEIQDLLTQQGSTDENYMKKRTSRTQRSKICSPSRVP